MIREIPEAMRTTLRTMEDVGPRIVRRLSRSSHLLFTGCGTAFFASMVGAAIASALTGTRIRIATISAFELAHYPVGLGISSAVLGVSHSGITKTTLEAVRKARSQRAYTVGVTHFQDRPLSEAANDIIIAGNGPDRSRCHTKCLVAAATALAVLATILDTAGSPRARRRFANDLEGLPPLAAEVLNSVHNAARDLAQVHVGCRAVYVMGTGPNAATAMEVALKLKETSFVPAEGMETEPMLHGPWLALDQDTLVIALVPKGKGRDRGLDLVRSARTVGAPVIAVATEGDQEAVNAATDVLELPETHELLSPFLAVLPLYFLAYYSSVFRGNNPDVLRYLTPSYWKARQTIFPPGTH